MTILDVLVVCVCLLIVAAILLPILARQRKHDVRLGCISNLRIIGLTLHIWAGDNNNRYPMSVSVTNGGGMELIETGNPVRCFQVTSNEMGVKMGTTKILVCPNDSARTFATNWNDLNGSHISYFLSPDATNYDNWNRVLIGDDNFQLNGSPVKSGLLNLSANTLIEWALGRHSDTLKPHFWSFSKMIYVGNVGLADGSVDQESSTRLQQAFQGTGLATNRIAIP